MNQTLNYPVTRPKVLGCIIPVCILLKFSDFVSRKIFKIRFNFFFGRLCLGSDQTPSGRRSNDEMVYSSKN